MASKSLEWVSFISQGRVDMRRQINKKLTVFACTVLFSAAVKIGINVWPAFYGEHHILNRKRQIIV